eukprot:Clim_evm1s104 gene=Clim_evmTU1s104
MRFTPIARAARSVARAAAKSAESDSMAIRRAASKAAARQVNEEKKETNEKDAEWVELQRNLNDLENKML